MIQQHTDRSLAFTSAADDLLDRARRTLDDYHPGTSGAKVHEKEVELLAKTAAVYARMARAEPACAQALVHQQGAAYPADGNQGGVSEARRAGL